MAESPKDFKEFYEQEYLPLKQEVAQMQEKLSRAKLGPAQKKEVQPIEVPKDTFKVGGQAYRFMVARYRDLSGGLVNAADALNNPAELERLVTIKSGIIKKA